MSNIRELHILPSVIGDETERELRQLSKQEKKEFRDLVCRMISRDIGAYYSVHQEEWEEFAETISQERG